MAQQVFCFGDAQCGLFFGPGTTTIEGCCFEAGRGRGGGSYSVIEDGEETCNSCMGVIGKDKVSIVNDMNLHTVIMYVAC